MLNRRKNTNDCSRGSLDGWAMGGNRITTYRFGIRGMPYALVWLFATLLVFMTGCGDEVEVRSGDSGTRTPGTPPNVIFILADDMGWMDAGSYGSDLYETPSLDRLAQTAVRFTNSYSASPLCSPTRASILTGQEPGRLHFTVPLSGPAIDVEKLNAREADVAPDYMKATIPGSVNRLLNSYVTFAEVLKDNGYATAFMGKWHLGKDPYLPENQGFDVVVGGRYNAGPPGGYFSPWNIDTLPHVPAGKHISDVLTDSAIQFVEDNQSKPFLLCLWYYDVHGPFQVKDELLDKYTKKTDQFTRMGVRTRQRNPVMGAMMETMDTNIGRLMESLYALQLDTQTIVIFTSDNGGNKYDVVGGKTVTSNAPLRAGKGNNYEGGVRVPMIVRAPGMAQHGTVSDVVVSSTDHYATILDLLNIPVPSGTAVDSVSYRPALNGEAYERPAIFSMFPHAPPATGSRPNLSMRQGPWRLYKFFFDSMEQEHRYELYNLDRDIGEQTNLVDKNPEIAEQMAQAMTTHTTELGYLQPRLNPNYMGNVAGPWHGSAHTVLAVENRVLSIESTGVTPYIETPYFPANDKNIFRFEFDMLSSSSGNGSISWTYKSNNEWSETNAAAFVAFHDGTWRHYSIPIKLEEAVSMLRIQPSTGPGSIQMKNIEMTSEDGDPIRSWPLY